MADPASAFAAAFLVTHRPIDPVARATADRRAWELTIQRWARREQRLLARAGSTAERAARRIAEGRCAACRTRMAPPDHATCEPCRASIAAAEARRKTDRIAAGLCSACGRYPLASKVRCRECLAADARRTAARKAKREGLR